MLLAKSVKSKHEIPSELRSELTTKLIFFGIFISRYTVGVLSDQTRRISVCACDYTTVKDSNVTAWEKTAKPKIEADEHDELNEPIRYSTSKAKGWSVDQSFGKDRKQRPVWKVALLSGTLLAILAWTFLRKETEIDRMLEKDLYQQWEERYPNYVAPAKDKR